MISLLGSPKTRTSANSLRWRNAAMLFARVVLTGSGRDVIAGAGVRHSERPPKKGQRLRQGFLLAFAVTGGDAVGPSVPTITPCQMNICRQT
jgi:hypothetical protein